MSKIKQNLLVDPVGLCLYRLTVPMMIGIVVGTYSSIYVAGSLAVAFGLTRQNLIPAAKIVDGLP